MQNRQNIWSKFFNLKFTKPSSESITIATIVFLAYIYRQKVINEALLHTIKTVLKDNKITEKNCKQIQAYLEYGANPRITFKFRSKQLPLISLPVLYKQKKLFDYLLQRGAYSNGWTLSDIKNVNTILLNEIEFIAKNTGGAGKTTPDVTENNWKKVKECLYHGADPDLKFGDYQLTLLSFAVYHQKKNIFDLLLRCGADINACSVEGWTPLSILIRYWSYNNFINIEDLLNNGANPNAMATFSSKKEDAFSPLHLAIIFGHKLNGIQSLIDFNADVNFKNGSGHTPLQQAIRFPDYKTTNIVKILCDAKASIDINNNGQTIFDLLNENSQRNLFETIMEHAHFDFEKEYDNKWMKTVHLVLNRCNALVYDTKDLRYMILSKLLESHPHKGLYNQLLSRKHKLLPHPLLLVNKHVKYLTQIISNSPGYQEKPFPLKRGFEKLQKDTITFNEIYLNDLKNLNKQMSFLKENMVLAIYKNQYASLETNPITFAF